MNNNESIFSQRLELHRRLQNGEGVERVFSFATPEIHSINEDRKTIVYVITSSAIDRFGEIVDPRGLDMTNFRKSKRTVFWNHDYDRVIGRSLWEERRGEQWIAEVQFAADVTAFANDIWNLARKGYIGMVSIGFIPREYEVLQLVNIEDINPSNRSEYGPETEIWIWRSAELVEYSLVGVGANPDAVEYERILKSGILQSGTMKNELTAAIQECRLCELEKCRTTLEALPREIADLRLQIEEYRLKSGERNELIEKVRVMVRDEVGRLKGKI